MPNAMFAATPPRRTCRSEVRNDREILSSCSTTRESAKRPSKVMRWSVAMEPVMAICTARTSRAPTVPHRGRVADRRRWPLRTDLCDDGAAGTGRRRPRPRDGRALRERCRAGGSAERVAARAAAAGVRVVDREALLLDRVGEIDRGALEVRRAHPVDDDLDTVEVADEVAIEAALVEVELVDQAGAAAGLDAHAQAEVVTTLLLEQALDLGGRDVRQDDTVGGSLGLNLGGRCVRLDTHVLVLHVVEHGSGVTTRAMPDVFPALQGYVALGRKRAFGRRGRLNGWRATTCEPPGRRGPRGAPRGGRARQPPGQGGPRRHTPRRGPRPWPRADRRVTAPALR